MRKARKADKSVEDIDLFIDAIKELATEEDISVGSTFLCLIGDVFSQFKLGLLIRSPSEKISCKSSTCLALLVTSEMVLMT